jgi:alpha-1,6-mannosyltransferase
VIVFVSLDVLRCSGQRAHLVLAYAWNPLLAIEVAGSGHIDIVGALLLLLSAAALKRRWRAPAAIALGLAVAVKLLPIVLLPLYWKRVRIRDVALATAVVGMLYVPFLHHGRIPTGSLHTYVQGFRFNGPVFAILAHMAPPQVLAGLAVLAGLVCAAWLRSTARECSTEVFAWPMAATLLFAPVVFPWYLLWLLPFLGSASTLLIMLWTVSIIPTYIMWHWRTLGRPWGSLPGWVMLLEYGCVATAGAILALRRITRSDAPAGTSK